MGNNKFLPVSLLVIAMFSCLSTVAKDSAEAEDKLSEFETALKLTPDIDKGRKLYKTCVVCHGPEGWGDSNGSYPQIAGQLPGVIIKQLADIRAGNRDNPIMRAFTTVRALGGAQEIADVAGYIAALPMTPYNGLGNSRRLELGKEIFQRDCADCHGYNGEGDAKKNAPILYGQHYQYMERQYSWIRSGLRRNANKEMVEQIQGYSSKEEDAVLSYTASLLPPDEKLAKEDWQNPDFPNYHRSWRPDPVRERRGSNR